MTDQENSLIVDRNTLVYVENQFAESYLNSNKEFQYVKNNFCGKICSRVEDFSGIPNDVIIYLCGDIKVNASKLSAHRGTIYVIAQLSYNYDDADDQYGVISMGQVPINMHGVGVYVRDFFDPSKDYFNLITKEHQFQVLTESNKASNSYRKGIYLTPIEQGNDEIKFRLLRCSSNLRGPTDNFRTTDKEIVGQVNNMCKCYFSQPTELNHVLAQVYENKLVNDKQRKAKIKEHSDKTKDMPRNGLIAFCTFYNGITTVSKSNDDPYDYCYNGKTSVLTRMRFRLKKMVSNSSLVKEFYIKLYPNSMFVMSLEMNRLYTHEIVPSQLPVDKIPTRLGYVIRCSNTEAVFKNGKTYIDEHGDYKELVVATESDVIKLKETYLKENMTAELIEYDKIYFSLNQGDYEKPYL